MRFINTLFTVLFLSTGFTAYAASVPAATSLSDLDDVLSPLPLDTSVSKLNAIFADRVVAVYCQTTGSSPTISDTHAAVDCLIADSPLPTECIQMNMNPELGIITCTQMVSYKSAKLRICGGPGQRVKCITAGWAAKHIANNCKSASNRAEGYYIFEAANCTVSVR